MIFLRLFLTFSKIGLFNFGGGYAMLSFIQNEVVIKNQWMTDSEFTDIVAISQMTPGPIGINAATYTGYTAVMNDAAIQELCSQTPMLIYPLGIAGSVVATLSVIWLPFIVMVFVSKLILKHKDSIVTQSIFSILRPAIVGLLASAVLVLLCDVNFQSISKFSSVNDNFGIDELNFGSISESPIQFFVSIGIFLSIFIGAIKWHWNLIYTIIGSGIIGAIIYGILGL